MPPVTDVDRREIERAAAGHDETLYTRAALDAAAALLADVYGAASRHGVRKDAWPRVADLPAACLSVMGAQIADQRARLDPADVPGLLDAVAFDLRGRGVTCSHVGDSPTMRVPRTLRMPPLGRDGLAGLVLALDRETGWTVRPEYAIGAGWAGATVIAPFDLAGATHVAALLADVATGHITRPDPFRRT